MLKLKLNLNLKTLFLVSAFQYYIHYSISLWKKNWGKTRESERDNFGRAFFNTAGQKYSPENNGASYVSLYGLGGLIGREVDNQDHGPSMKAVQQGLLAGAAPQGSSLAPYLFLSLGLWVSPGPLGTETVAPTSLQGPYRHQARNTLRRGGGGLLNSGGLSQIGSSTDR